MEKDIQKQHCVCIFLQGCGTLHTTFQNIVTEAEENDFLPELWYSDAGTEPCMFW